MQLTTTKNNENSTTYQECFEYLEQNLSNHFLLTQYKREQCVNAVQTLKRVFERFGNK